MSVLIYLLHGPLAQLGERQVRNLEVRGSIPLRSTKAKILSRKWQDFRFVFLSFQFSLFILQFPDRIF